MIKCSKCNQEAQHRIYFSDIEWDYVYACEDHLSFYASYKETTAKKKEKRSLVVLVE